MLLFKKIETRLFLAALNIKGAKHKSYSVLDLLELISLTKRGVAITSTKFGVGNATRFF